MKNRERIRTIGCILLAVLLILGSLPPGAAETVFAAEPKPYFNEVIITKEYDGDTFRPKQWHIILTGGNFLDSKGKLQVEIGVMGSDGKLNRFETTTRPSAHLLDYEVGLDQISDSIFINGETVDLSTEFPGVNAKEPNTGRVKSGEPITIRGNGFVTSTGVKYKIEDQDLTNQPPDTVIGNESIRTKLKRAGSAHFIMHRTTPSTILKKANGAFATIRVRQSYINIFKVFTTLGVSDDLRLIPTRGAVATGARVEGKNLLTAEQMDVFFVKNLSGPFTKEMIAPNKKYLAKTDTGSDKDRFAFQVPKLPVGTYHVVLTNKVDPNKPIDPQITALKILRQSFTIVDAKNQAKLVSIDPKKGPTTGIAATIKGQNLANMSPNFYKPGNTEPTKDTTTDPNTLILTYTGGKYADEPSKTVRSVIRKIKIVVGDLVTFDAAKPMEKTGVYDYFNVVLGQNTDLKKPMKDVIVEIETTVEFTDGTKIEGILESDVLQNAFEYETLEFVPEITGVNPSKIPVNSSYRITPEEMKITITGKNFFLYRYEKKENNKVKVFYRYPVFNFGNQFSINPNEQANIQIKMYKNGAEIDGTAGRHLADRILLTIPRNTVLADGEAGLNRTFKLSVKNPLKVPDSNEFSIASEYDIQFFKVDSNKAPVIIKVEPSRVSTSGQTKNVKIFGQNFSENVKVFLDGEEIRNPKRNGIGTEIDLQVPGGKPVGRYQLMILNNDGSIATFDDFWYVESFTKPKIKDFNPKKGTTYTLVNILGENFLYPNPAISSLEGVGIYNLIGTRVYLGDYEINKYNMQDGKIVLKSYDSKTQSPMIESKRSVLTLADYSDGIILKKANEETYFKLYYDFKKGKILLTDGKNDIYEMRGEGESVKAEKDGTPHDVVVRTNGIGVGGQDFVFMTPYAFDQGTGLLNGKKTKILNNGQIQIEVPALPRRGFYDVRVVNPDTNFDAKIGTDGFDFIPGPLDLPPVLKSVVPNKGSVEGGYQVVITGENFISEPTRKIRIFFDGIEVKPEHVIVKPGGKEMTVTVPKYNGNLEKETESDRKSVDVVALNPDGGSASIKGGFTYVISKSRPYLDRIIQHPNDPTVSGIRATVEGGDFRFMEPFKDVETLTRPLNGVHDPGELYTDVNGNGKWDDYRPLIKKGLSSKGKHDRTEWDTLIEPVIPEIFVGGYKAEVIRFTSTSIDILVPEKARGKVEVYLRNNDEGISNKINFEIELPKPKIVNILPNVGRKTGNEAVDIIGSGFENSQVRMYDATDVLPKSKSMVVTRFANEKDPKMGNSHITDMKLENSGLIAGDRAKVELGALIVRYEGESDPAELSVSYEEYGVLYRGTFKFANNDVFLPIKVLRSAVGKSPESSEAVRVTHEMLSGTANSYRILVERGYAAETQLKNGGLYTVWTPTYYTIGRVQVFSYGKDGGKSDGRGMFTYKNPDSNPTVSDLIKDNDPEDKEIKSGIKILKVSANGGNTIRIVGKEFRKPVKITFGENIVIDEKTVTYVPAEERNATEMYFTLPKVPETMANKGYKVFIENSDGGTANSGVLTDPKDPVDEIQLFFVLPESIDMKVTEVIPKTGPITGGTVVTIKGQDFRWEMKGYPNKHTEVYFMRENQPLKDRDGNDVLNLVKDKAQVHYDTIEIVTPPVEKEGPVDIKIVNPDGNTIFIPGGFKYTQSTLSIITVDPSKGKKKGGDTVTITGTGFMDGKINLYSSLSNLPTKAQKMLVRFGDLNDANISNRHIPEDDLQSGRLLKDGAKFKVGNIDFTVRPNGADYLVDMIWRDFSGEYRAASIPFSGEASYLPLSLLNPGATEMIKISRKINGVITRIIVERGYASGVVYNGETSLTVITPPYYTINRNEGDKGTSVFVINPDGSEATGSFIYKNPDSDPAIYSVEVDGISSDGEEHKGENPVLFRLPRGGKTRITVHGRDFRKGLTLTIAGKKIDEKLITYSDRIGDHPHYKTLTFTMPEASDDMIGQQHILSITNLDGGGTNSDATVRNPAWNAGKPNPAPIRFVFFLEETEHLRIDKITPDRGPTKGGNIVEIRGEDFRSTMYGFKGSLRIFVGSGIDMVEVKREDILSVEHDRITLRMPAHEEGTVKVRVQNPDGNSYEIEYRYEESPVITAVKDPEGGEVTALLSDGSQTIVIEGTGFKTGAVIYFNPQKANAEGENSGSKGETSTLKAFTGEDLKSPKKIRIDGKEYVIDGSISATAEKVEDGKKITIRAPEFKTAVRGIMVVNPDGNGSNVWDIALGIPKISAPFDVRAELVFGQMIRVSWKKVSGATQYDVLMSINGGSWETVANTKDSSVSVTDLLPNTAYVFLVKAVGKYSESEPLKRAQSNSVHTGATVGPIDKDGAADEKTRIVRNGENVDLRLGKDWSPAGRVLDLLKPEYAGAKNITVRIPARIVAFSDAPLIIKTASASLTLRPSVFRTEAMIRHAIDPKAGIVFKMTQVKGNLKAKNSAGQVSTIYQLEAYSQIGKEKTGLIQLSAPFEMTLKSDAAKIRARKLKKIVLSYFDPVSKMWVPITALNKLGYYGMWGGKK